MKLKIVSIILLFFISINFASAYWKNVTMLPISLPTLDEYILAYYSFEPSYVSPEKVLGIKNMSLYPTGTDTTINYNGKINQSVHFTGTNSNGLRFNSIIPPTGEFSIVLWFNQSSAEEQYRAIVDLRSSRQLMILSNYGYIKYYPDGVTLKNCGNASVNNWTHLAFVYNGSDVFCYINTTLTNHTTVNILNTSETAYSTLGIGYDGSLDFNGSIDELGFWKRALTEKEINDSYNYFLGIQFYYINLIENSQTYTSPTSELTETSFEINATINGGWTNQLAYLFYNHTLYNATISTVDGNSIVTKTLTTPDVGAATNVSFVWEFKLTNSTGDYWFNSSLKNQTVTTSQIGLCTSTLNISLINFTIQDENTFTNINSSFIIHFTGEGFDYSYEDTTQVNSSFAFCFNPDAEYTMSADIEYSADGYEPNYYFLNDIVLTNQTTNITLYLLNDTLGDPIVIRVLDNSQLPIEEAYVSIQKYDSITNTFYTVGMAKTDFNGEDVVYLNYYDTYYRYSIVKDGELLSLTGTSKIYSSPIRIIIKSSTEFTYEKFKNIGYTLTFNNVTKNFILTYTDTTGDIATACLLVTKRTTLNDTTICSNCESSNSATIYCDISSYGNGTYIAQFYATGSLGYIDFLDWIEGGANEIYTALGEDATFYAFLLGIIILAVFLVNPILGVIGVILGIFAGAALGFQPVNYMEFIGITIVGGIVIMLIGGRR